MYRSNIDDFPTPMEIRVYYDYKDKTKHTMVWLDDGKYILNYWPYEIVNTKQIEELIQVRPNQ